MEGRGRERGKTRRRRRTDGEDSHHHQPMHNQLTALITGLGWTEPEASLLSAVPTAHCSHTPAPHYSISQSESQSINQSPATCNARTWGSLLLDGPCESSDARLRHFVFVSCSRCSRSDIKVEPFVVAPRLTSPSSYPRLPLYPSARPCPPVMLIEESHHDVPTKDGGNMRMLVHTLPSIPVPC